MITTRVTRPSRTDGARDPDAIEPGQSQVDHRDVGELALDRRQCLAAVGGLAGELHLGARRDGAYEALAEERVVVRDEDPESGHSGTMVDQNSATHPIG